MYSQNVDVPGQYGEDLDGREGSGDCEPMAIVSVCPKRENRYTDRT
jgi:hypothetical protein